MTNRKALHKIKKLYDRLSSVNKIIVVAILFEALS